MTKNLKKKIKIKISSFIKKIAITCDIKKMNINPWPKKLSSNLLSNPNGGFLTFEFQKIWIMSINVKKLEKNGYKYQKYAKIRDVEILQDIPFF